MLVTPPRFEADLLAGIGDGYISRILTEEIAAFTADCEAPLPAELQTRFAFNPNLTGSWFVGVTEIINNVTVIAIILAGAALIREREHGTIPLFLAGSLLYLFFATGLGIFLGTIARSMPQFGFLFMLMVLPMNLLSGGETPLEAQPDAPPDVHAAGPLDPFRQLRSGHPLSRRRPHHHLAPLRRHRLYRRPLLHAYRHPLSKKYRHDGSLIRINAGLP